MDQGDFKAPNAWSHDDLAGLLINRIISDESAQATSPHIVICRSESTGLVSYDGPYASGMAALVAAEGDSRAAALAEAEGERDLSFRVAPLFKPHYER